MTLFRTSLLLLIIVLLIVDGWPALAGTPEPDSDAWIDDLERVLRDGGEGMTNE